MSEANEEKEGEEGGGESLEELARRVRNQMRLLFAAAITTVLLMASVGFTYMSLSGAIVVGTEEPLMEMKNLSGMVSDEYEDLNMAVEFHNHLLESVNTRLDEIDPSVDQSQFMAIQQVLVAQEKDFQYFLETTKLAVTGLSEMVSGSRGWREDFFNKLDVAIATSEERELALAEGLPESSLAGQVDDEPIAAADGEAMGNAGNMNEASTATTGTESGED